jgi:hypothetical protein
MMTTVLQVAMMTNFGAHSPHALLRLHDSVFSRTAESPIEQDVGQRSLPRARRSTVSSSPAAIVLARVAPTTLINIRPFGEQPLF